MRSQTYLFDCQEMSLDKPGSLGNDLMRHNIDHESEVRTYHNVVIAPEMIAAFCRKNGIRKLSLFGSILDRDFRADSDIDVLVEFAPGRPVGLIRLSGMERELSQLLGKSVDLRTPADLNTSFRDEVVRNAEVQYVEQ